MWGQSRSNCFLHNSHRQKVVNTLIWYKLLYFLAYWSRFGLSHCRTVQNEELIEDEKATIQAVNEGKNGISIILPEFVNEKKVSKYLMTNQEVVTKNEEKDENSVNEQKNESNNFNGYTRFFYSKLCK